MNLRQVTDWMSEVVRVESPIHLQELVTRIRTAARVGRAGSRIRQRMEEAIRYGVRTNKFERRGDFLWRPGHRESDVRSRDGQLPDTAKALRKIEMIAPEEIARALCHAVSDSFGIGEDEAISDVCRMFGFQRTGSKITSQVQSIVNQLLREGILRRSGAQLRIP